MEVAMTCTRVGEFEARFYQLVFEQGISPTKAPLAGYGMQSLSHVSYKCFLRNGLPLSRLYARYFHGDLILNSYDG